MHHRYDLLLLALSTLLSSSRIIISSGLVLPTPAMRQTLIERSEELQIVREGYAARSWSNRAGTVLTPVHVDPVGVYSIDRPFYWNGIDVGCRATVIELPRTSRSEPPDLWVHSPVHLDGPLLQCLQQLGTVRYICSTNYEHVKYVSLWYQSYKDTADLWACPGLSERMPELPWKGEIPKGYRPPGGTWSGPVPADPDGLWEPSILQPLHLNIERNPFTGQPFFNEVIFFHAPTKTLLCTDLFWNYPATGIPNAQHGQDDAWELAPAVDAIPRSSRLWKWGMDQVYAPFYRTFMVTDAAEYRAIVHHILNVWEVETVIPAHGDILRGRAFIRSVLSRALE
jgi:Domain of unknown function (DUF4336)